MKMRRTLAGLGVLAVATALTACSGGSAGGNSNALTGKVTGTITVLTNRTDLVDTTFKTYASEFEKLYPGTNVKFQAITNYEQDVTTRLTSHNAGDVLLIPAAISKAQLPQFFQPLGTEASLSKTYRFMTGQTYGGTSYGIPTFGNTTGMVYNKTVWAKAGITSDPKTPAEFIADLQAIKSKTGAIPYYTNYKDQWPLPTWNTNWSVTGDANETNALNSNPAPWSSDTNVKIGDSLLFDIVHDKLSEPDPTTTAWESSKGFLATGKIATMHLGSWAITQMQAAAKAAGKDPSEIGYMPFPYQVNGQYVATIGPDYFNGISKTSKNKPAAYAWIKWFTTKSGFAAASGAIPSAQGSSNPSTLADFTKLGVKYLEQAPAPKGKEALQSTLMKQSQIDLTGGLYLQKLIDVARGAASGTKQSYFASLNQAWGQAVKSAG